MEIVKREVKRPFEIAGCEGKFDVIATVRRRRLHRSGRSTETRYLKSTLRSRQRSVQTCTESSRISDKRLKNEGKKEVRSQKSKKSKPVLKEIGRSIPARNELLEGPLSEAQRIKLQSSTEERGALRLSDLSLRFACRECESNGNCAVTRALQGICRRSYAPWRPTTQDLSQRGAARFTFVWTTPGFQPLESGVFV